MATKMKWSGRERDAIMFACALENGLNGDWGKTLEKRIRMSGKTAWRDWRLAMRMTTKVLNQVLDTLPLNNYEQLDMALRKSSLRFVFPGPVRTPFYIVARADHVQEIGRRAMHSACRECLKSPQEAKSCPLHQALEWTAPLPDHPEGELLVCEYAQCVFDEEESI